MTSGVCGAVQFFDAFLPGFGFLGDVGFLGNPWCVCEKSGCQVQYIVHVLEWNGGGGRLRVEWRGSERGHGLSVRG